MKILVDMNLSPDWVAVLKDEGFDAVHWSAVGKAEDEDSVIFDWARENEYIVFTHDLDFGALLALSGQRGPSVIQIRAQNILPSHLSGFLVSAIRENSRYLESGALIVIDEMRARVRILPI